MLPLAGHVATVRRKLGMKLKYRVDLGLRPWLIGEYPEAITRVGVPSLLRNVSVLWQALQDHLPPHQPQVPIWYSIPAKSIYLFVLFEFFFLPSSLQPNSCPCIGEPPYHNLSSCGLMTKSHCSRQSTTKAFPLQICPSRPM